LATCVDSDPFVTIARSNFDQALADALADIRTELYPAASFVMAQPDVFNYSNYGLPTIIARGSNRLSELDPLLFEVTIGKGLIGNYYPSIGRIFLKKTKWCRHTLIHETLHSVSTFADQHNIRTAIQYRFLNEGLTELFSGYILWKKYNSCYVFWKNRYPNVRCTSSESYHKWTRLWYTFCRFVPFNTVAELFFNDNHLLWADQWSNFLQDISNIGYTFSDPLRRSQGIPEDRFLLECKKSFGENQVEKIFEKDSYDFDFSKLMII
jgi:hypothetical protein